MLQTFSGLEERLVGRWKSRLFWRAESNNLTHWKDSDSDQLQFSEWPQRDRVEGRHTESMMVV